jgi:molybdopterin synthase sulfur carrier subunit
VRIILSGPLLRFADYNRVVEIAAGTLADAVTELNNRYPRLRPVLLDSDGSVSSLHRIVLNGQITTAPDPATPLADGDEVEFLTAIAGG